MATLSSKVTPSGVATAAQGTLADSAVQPNDSPTFNAVTASDITLDTGTGSLLTFQDSTGTNGYKLRANVSNVADYGFLIEDLAGGDLLKVESDGTVTATSYAGDGSALTGIAAGATGGGNDDIFYENGQNVTTNYTITNGKNAMSAGPITIDSGVTVTVGAGETWTVV